MEVFQLNEILTFLPEACLLNQNPKTATRRLPSTPQPPKFLQDFSATSQALNLRPVKDPSTNRGHVLKDADPESGRSWRRWMAQLKMFHLVDKGLHETQSQTSPMTAFTMLSSAVWTLEKEVKDYNFGDTHFLPFSQFFQQKLKMKLFPDCLCRVELLKSDLPTWLELGVTPPSPTHTLTQEVVLLSLPLMVDEPPSIQFVHLPVMINNRRLWQRCVKLETGLKQMSQSSLVNSVTFSDTCSSFL